MANKTTANAFMASAQKSKREMADIQKEGSGKHETDEVELKKISLLIPAWLHKEAQLHRVETGERIYCTGTWRCRRPHFRNEIVTDRRRLYGKQ